MAMKTATKTTVAPALAALAALIALTGMLAGCADLPYRLPGERAAELSGDKGLILFSTETVGKTAQKRIQYTDNEQRVDYALFQGQGDSKGAQAEFVYMETKGMVLVAFEFPFTILDKVKTWNFSKDQPMEWGKAVQLRTRVGPIFFRPYRLTGLNRQCFGMSGEWETHQLDEKLRDTRIMFGYYCAAPGQALSEKEMLSLVDRIGLRGTTERSPGYADPVYNFYGDVEEVYGGSEGTKRAVKMAQGAGTPHSTGIGEFPFRYAEPFTVSGGDNVSN